MAELLKDQQELVKQKQ